jgi:hypothetical protein
MSAKPFDWSIIILGRWNQAILTPAGIAKYLFKVKDPKTLEVAVPMDGISPYQVKCPNSAIVVMTENNLLRINLLDTDYDTLCNAMKIGVNALKSLPETPVTAAGFNVKFRSHDYDSNQTSLVNSKIDDILSDQSYKILSRTINRSLEYNSGKLNIIIFISDNSFDVTFNFHRDSKNINDLVQWLETSKEKIESKVIEILNALNLEIEETKDDI